MIGLYAQKSIKICPRPRSILTELKPQENGSFSAKVFNIAHNSPLCDVTVTSLGMSRNF